MQRGRPLAERAGLFAFMLPWIVRGTYAWVNPLK